MDPLWVLVILVGFASLTVAVAFIVIAVKVSGMARQVAPKVSSMQEQLTAAEAEIQKMAVAVESAEERFNTMADKASSATGRVAGVIGAVPRVIRGVRDTSARAEGTMRAIAIVTARTLRRSHRNSGQ